MFIQQSAKQCLHIKILGNKRCHVNLFLAVLLPEKCGDTRRPSEKLAFIKNTKELEHIIYETMCH